MKNLTADFDSERHQQLLTLRLFKRGGARFAVPAAEIASVAPWRHAAPLPQAPQAVLGVISIQGRMLTLLDPVLLLEQTPTENGSNGLIVALRGDEQLGLIIDDEGERLRAEISPPDRQAAGATLGIIKHNEETIPVLNVKELFNVAIRGRERRQRRF